MPAISAPNSRGDVFGADVGILHHVVQQRRGDGGAVEQLLGEDRAPRAMLWETKSSPDIRF